MNRQASRRTSGVVRRSDAAGNGLPSHEVAKGVDRAVV
jgi:hypothetical protein